MAMTYSLFEYAKENTADLLSSQPEIVQNEVGSEIRSFTHEDTKPNVMYLLDKLKPFEQKFFSKRAKWVGMVSSLCLCRTSVQAGLKLRTSRLEAEH